MAEKTVDDYIKKLPPEQADITRRIRKLVRLAAPEAEEAVKWAQPVWSVDGPMVYLKAFPKAVNFGFWRGAELSDPRGLLEGTGDRMRHLKVASSGEMDEHEDAIVELVRQAADLNRAKGDPTKGR